MIDNMDKEKWIRLIAGTIIIIGIACVGSILLSNITVEPVEMKLKTGDKGDTVKAELTAEIKPDQRQEKKKVIVDIKGQVKNPGVYELEDGQRIADAINLAGGVSDKADVSGVNRAAKVQDGQVIYIPEKGEIISNTLSEPKSNGKININTAGKEELMKLPGVGETIAQAIIDYREQHNAFQSLDELMNVTGIGEVKFDKLKDLIEIY